MLDLKTVWAEAAGVIEDVSFVGPTPPTIDIRLRSPVSDVYSITFNGHHEATTWYIQPGNVTLRVLIPSEISKIDKIDVSVKPRSLDAAGGRFEIRNAEMCTGADRLLQVIIRLFTTRPRTILGHPGIGFLPRLQGIPVEEWATEIQASFRGIQEVILGSQRKKKPAMASERLVKIELVRIVRIPATGAVRIRTRIITEAGNILRDLSYEE